MKIENIFLSADDRESKRALLARVYEEEIRKDLFDLREKSQSQNVAYLASQVMAKAYGYVEHLKEKLGITSTADAILSQSGTSIEEINGLIVAGHLSVCRILLDLARSDSGKASLVRQFRHHMEEANAYRPFGMPKVTAEDVGSSEEELSELSS